MSGREKTGASGRGARIRLRAEQIDLLVQALSSTTRHTTQLPFRFWLKHRLALQMSTHSSAARTSDAVTNTAKRAHFLLYTIFERDEGRLRNGGEGRTRRQAQRPKGELHRRGGAEEAQARVHAGESVQGACAVQLEFELWGVAAGLPAAAVDSSGALALPARRWRPVWRLLCVAAGVCEQCGLTSTARRG